MDFILNGQAQGSVAATLLRNNFDVATMRPWVSDALGRTRGKSFVTLMRNGKEVNVLQTNANATLRKEEWILLDQAVIKAAKPRLRAVTDIRSAGLVFTIPNGLSKTVLDTETQSDINEAVMSMDGLRESQGDRPMYALTHMPLPIYHKDFSFSARQIAASRNGGSPLDTTMAELAGRRVGELIEQVTLGVSPASTFPYGGGTIYGLSNFNSRNTKTLTAPTATAWTPTTLVTQILQMRGQSQADNMYGPWVLYTAPNWDTYLDSDYTVSTSTTTTLRARLKLIDGITDVKRLDYLTGYTILMVQLTADVIRMVVGLELTTVQWESHGGMKQNFKVMAMITPQVRADFNGNCGIVHGS